MRQNRGDAGGQAMSGQLGGFAGAGWAGWWSAAAMEMAGRDYRAGDREAAARRCRELIAQDAWHFEALHLLGVVCLERGQFAEAATYLERAGRARPDAAAVFFQLGNALAGLERHEAAIAALRRAVALEPGTSTLSTTWATRWPH